MPVGFGKYWLRLFALVYTFDALACLAASVAGIVSILSASAFVVSVIDSFVRIFLFSDLAPSVIIRPAFLASVSIVGWAISLALFKLSDAFVSWMRKKTSTLGS